MPANRFAPERVIVGQEQDARIVDRILQAILARWPIDKCDIRGVYSAAIDWTDGATIPTENINVDELFNNATGIAAALGCLDFLNGMSVGYVDGETISISPGHVLHRAGFKIVECDEEAVVTLGTAGLVTLGDGCDPEEGNDSGLDSDKWYYVYANLDVAGTTPAVAEFIRISAKVPVNCDGKGWEHPTYDNYRFIGSIRTMATGVIRPFNRYGNGWVHWHTAEVASDYQAAEYMRTGGTEIGFSSSGFVRYTLASTGDPYHDGDKHIPPTADACKVAVAEGNTSGSIRLKPVGSADRGYNIIQSPENQAAEVTIPVNPPNVDDIDKQTFMIDAENYSHRVDVTGYSERLQ